MRILVVHQYYLLPGYPGGSRFNEFARLWTRAGHQVSVIAGTVDYSTGQTLERYRGRWVIREDDAGVDVYRCHVPDTYNRSYVGRMWAFSGFTASALTAAMKVGKPDVVIGTSPPLLAALPAYAAARRHHVPFIFEIRDLWPESAVTTGVLSASSPMTRGLYRLERWACQVADRINVLTPAFREDLIKRGLARGEKIAFVPNGADLDLFTPGPADRRLRQKMGWEGRFVAMYAGAHGRANGLKQLLEAAEYLKGRPEILISCVGDGPERLQLQAEANARGLTNIQFAGPQAKERMPDLVRACDVGMAVLQKNPTFRTVYPNKVFDYMACERPTLLAIDGVARDLVCEQARAGVFAEPGNGRAIADALIALEKDSAEREAMGRRGHQWVVANASREALASRYLQVMQELAHA